MLFFIITAENCNIFVDSWQIQSSKEQHLFEINNLECLYSHFCSI